MSQKVTKNNGTREDSATSGESDPKIRLGTQSPRTSKRRKVTSAFSTVKILSADGAMELPGREESSSGLTFNFAYSLVCSKVTQSWSI